MNLFSKKLSRFKGLRLDSKEFSYMLNNSTKFQGNFPEFKRILLNSLEIHLNLKNFTWMLNNSPKFKLINVNYKTDLNSEEFNLNQRNSMEFYWKIIHKWIKSTSLEFKKIHLNSYFSVIKMYSTSILFNVIELNFSVNSKKLKRIQTNLKEFIFIVLPKLDRAFYTLK